MSPWSYNPCPLNVQMSSVHSSSVRQTCCTFLCFSSSSPSLLATSIQLSLSPVTQNYKIMRSGIPDSTRLSRRLATWRTRCRWLAPRKLINNFLSFSVNDDDDERELWQSLLLLLLRSVPFIAAQECLRESLSSREWREIFSGRRLRIVWKMIVTDLAEKSFVPIKRSLLGARSFAYIKEIEGEEEGRRRWRWRRWA